MSFAIGQGYVLPRECDLTAEKIVDRMKFIQPGDSVLFDSAKACYTADQLARHSAFIPATGIVEENNGGYLTVRLRGGLIEYVNYFAIQAVNNLRFHGYSRGKRR